MKGGKVQLRNVYLLDASTLTAPYRHAVFLLKRERIADRIDQHACAAAGKICNCAFGCGGRGDGRTDGIRAGLGHDRHAGLEARRILGPEGMFNGHDGVWYWTRARELARSNMPWAAWYCYDAAHYLELPVDFISSPNLDKLTQEQGKIKAAHLRKTSFRSR